MPDLTSMNYKADANTVKGATIVLTVKPTLRFRLRLWLAIQIMRIAAFVAGFGFDVRTDDEGESQ